MTAAAASRKTIKKLNAGDRYYEHLVVTAAKTIFHGTMATIVAAGTIEPAVNAATSLRIMGVNMQGKDAAAGTKPRIETGEFWFANNDTITVTSIGAIGYAADDQSINKTAGATPVIAGEILAVDTVLGVLVRIDPALNNALAT